MAARAPRPGDPDGLAGEPLADPDGPTGDGYDEESVRRNMYSPSLYLISSSDAFDAANAFVAGAARVERESQRRFNESVGIIAVSTGLMGVVLLLTVSPWAALPGALSIAATITRVISGVTHRTR